MELNITEIVLLGALVFCFLVQLYYSLFVHLKLGSVKIMPIPDQAAFPISVIVYARNEAKSLEKYLPNLLAQDYQDFEIVVVNDRSWDGTFELLERLAKQHQRLKVVSVADGDKFIAGKKFAVTMGIKAASHEWLVLTDADCEPASINWLKGMQQPSDTAIEMILGYAPYLKKRGLLNVLIRFEVFFSSVNYLAYALKGSPYRGVGKNLAYKKSLFFSNKGFAAHMHIPVGDDALFVNANANRHNTMVQLHKEAQVWTAAPTSLFAYLREKKAQQSIQYLYKTGQKWSIAFAALTRFLFYALTIALLFFKATLYLAIGIFALNLLVRSCIYPKLLKRLNDAELRWWFPLLDIISFVFLGFNSFLSIFVKKAQWK